MPASGGDGAVLQPEQRPRVEFALGSKVELSDSLAMGTYFKSSFAKSMALTSEHQSKSLDCSALNAALRARADPEFAAAARGRAVPLSQSAPGETAKLRRDSCIPRGGPRPADADTGRIREDEQQQQQEQRPGPQPQQPDATGKELARLRKELQTLQEENRRLQAGRPTSALHQLQQPSTADMVDNVLLQNQVDTLQWQLRQTENSRHMYRAVMEQVVRFLERAHRNLKLAASTARPKTPNSRVPRSRSVHTVDVCPGRASPGPGHRDSRDSLPDFQRAKSITQIEDSQSYSAFRDFTWRRPRPSQSDLEEVPPEKLSQEAFRLLRTVQSLLNTREPDLAHRLSGSGSGSGSGDSEPRSEPRSERSSVVSLDQADGDASPTPTKESAAHASMHAVMHAAPGGSAHASLVADVTGALRRKLNIRNSQVVSCASYNRLRESAAESLSNSSASTTEDGDYDVGPAGPAGPASLLSGLESAFSGSSHHHHLNGHLNGHHNGHLNGGNRLEEARQALRKEEALYRSKGYPSSTPQPSLSLSSAEDESGFSSMGSFQEVGLPLPLLSSTQLNGTSEPPASSASSASANWHHPSAASASPAPSSRSQGSFHEVGLPVAVSRPHGPQHGKPPVPIHRRWRSNPVEALSRSAYNGAEALRVLWV